MPSCLRGWTVSCGHRVPLKGFQQETKIMKVFIKVSQRRMCTLGKRGKTEMEMGGEGTEHFYHKILAVKEIKEQFVCFLCRPKFGGKYCTGERKRYRLCNIHPCRPDTPTFRQMQCSEFDTVPYRNEFYHWFPVFNPGKEL